MHGVTIQKVQLYLFSQLISADEILNCNGKGTFQEIQYEPFGGGVERILQ